MFPRLFFLVVGVLLLNAAPLFAGDVRVVDGDTVMVDGRSFHLHGIDAPALDEVCTASNGVTWPCGRRVRDQLMKAAALDEMVCQAVERETVRCRVAGLDIGALLVKEGLAKAAGDDYRDIEGRARAAKVGIWQ